MLPNARALQSRTWTASLAGQGHILGQRAMPPWSQDASREGAR